MKLRLLYNIFPSTKIEPRVYLENYNLTFFQLRSQMKIDNFFYQIWINKIMKWNYSQC